MISLGVFALIVVIAITFGLIILVGYSIAMLTSGYSNPGDMPWKTLAIWITITIVLLIIVTIETVLVIRSALKRRRNSRHVKNTRKDL